MFGLDNATTGGIGVIGQSAATSGSSIGVFGQSASTGGTGVVGTAAAKSGAVYGVGGYAASTGRFSTRVQPEARTEYMARAPAALEIESWETLSP
jgi:hypothetical protein